MRYAHPRHKRVSATVLANAMVALCGVLLIAAGVFADNHSAFVAGVAITTISVVNGTLLLVMRR